MQKPQGRGPHGSNLNAANTFALTTCLAALFCVPLAFAGWYLLSIVYSVLNKQVLTMWKFPCVFSAVQLLVGSVWILLLWSPLPTLGLGRAAPELRGECSPHSARSWNLGRELRRSVSTRGSREAVSRSGRIQFGCIPVAAGPFTPVRLVNRLLVRCLLIRASDVTVHPYSPYLGISYQS